LTKNGLPVAALASGFNRQPERIVRSTSSIAHTICTHNLALKTPAVDQQEKDATLCSSIKTAHQ